MAGVKPDKLAFDKATRRRPFTVRLFLLTGLYVLYFGMDVLHDSLHVITEIFCVLSGRLISRLYRLKSHPRIESIVR